MIDPKNLPIFPGVSRPSSDFPSVRSELRAWPMYREIDLSTARSLSDGTAEVLPLVGNMIYIDPRQNSGFATLHVQDDASVGNTPITVLPGQVLKVPFTQLILENVAQAGMVLRIIYGTDLEFDPTNAAGVSVLNAINVNDVIASSCQFISPALAGGVGANQVTTIVDPALNVSGVRVRSLTRIVEAGAGGTVASRTLASLAAPVSFASTASCIHLSHVTVNSSVRQFVEYMNLNRTLPAGWGLYNITTVTVAAAAANSDYISLEFL